MAYDDKIKSPDGAQNVIMENRSKLSVSGVESVVSFDDATVIADTLKGTIIVHGSGLHMEKLNLDNGEIKVEGTIDGVEYEDSEPSGGGLFSRLFR